MNLKLNPIVNEIGYSTNVFSLERAPAIEEIPKYLKFIKKNKCHIIGFCAHREFPKPCLKTHKSLIKNISGWCHCFRDPENYLPPNVPRILLSRSDFVYIKNKEKYLKLDKEYDLIYVCLSKHQFDAKNIDFFISLLPILCHDMNLKMAVVGDDTVLSYIPDYDNLFKLTKQDRENFLQLLSKSECLLVPNILDASPRVMAEAMCLDVKIVVNENILGGWKYVNSETGTFFSGMNDCISKIQNIISAGMVPSQWFNSYYGPWNSGKKLRLFIESICQTEVSGKFFFIYDKSLYNLRNFNYRIDLEKSKKSLTSKGGKTRREKIRSMVNNKLTVIDSGVKLDRLYSRNRKRQSKHIKNVKAKKRRSAVFSKSRRKNDKL